jgi:hypothetical protein
MSNFKMLEYFQYNAMQKRLQDSSVIPICTSDVDGIAELHEESSVSELELKIKELDKQIDDLKYEVNKLKHENNLLKGN